ncbi:MAG: hypothetical protein D3913_04155 [Candidatus Electrothrix sp. LOE1_4_5]|nr:hypothetical protein [Candidatus Electrothrix gigas]
MKYFILSALLLAALPALAQDNNCYKSDIGREEMVKCLEDKHEKSKKEIKGLREELKKTNDKLDAVLMALETINERLAKLPGRIIANIEFIYVPTGCFHMGSTTGENDEKPVHKVCLDGFWIGKYEITQGQWRAIMDTKPPSNLLSGINFDNYPVENASWNDVQKFIFKLKNKTGKEFRLPTEAEWEYACRGNSDDKYCGGNDLDAVAWHKDNSNNFFHPVGEKKANGFGLHDMSGSVAEWCADWYKENYNGSRENNPQGPINGSYRVIRGGGWNSMHTKMQATNRSWAADPDRGSWAGLAPDAAAIFPDGHDPFKYDGGLYMDMDMDMISISETLGFRLVLSDRQ